MRGPFGRYNSTPLTGLSALTDTELGRIVPIDVSHERTIPFPPNRVSRDVEARRHGLVTSVT